MSLPVLHAFRVLVLHVNILIGTLVQRATPS